MNFLTQQNVKAPEFIKCLESLFIPFFTSERHNEKTESTLCGFSITWTSPCNGHPGKPALYVGKKKGLQGHTLFFLFCWNTDYGFLLEPHHRGGSHKNTTTCICGENLIGNRVLLPDNFCFIRKNPESFDIWRKFTGKYMFWKVPCVHITSEASDQHRYNVTTLHQRFCINVIYPLGNGTKFFFFIYCKVTFKS